MKNSPPQPSLVSLRGEMIAQDKSGYLLLRNEQGTFRVKTAREAEPPARGTHLQVLGRLHSFVFSRCRRHHTYIEARVVGPVSDSDDLVSLFLPLLLGQ
jgi:hypothetical protein